jgi:hypothetical protein
MQLYAQGSNPCRGKIFSIPKPSDRFFGRLSFQSNGYSAVFKKLRGLSPRANYNDRPTLVGEVSAEFC